MRFEDYYQIMGIDADADAAAVKQAYRRLARKFHPDLNDGADAHAAMLKVNEAYEVLSNAQRRAAYDGVHKRHSALRVPAAKATAEQNGRNMPSDWKQGFQFEGAPSTGQAGNSGEGFSDFFTSMFGRASKPEAADAAAARGSDEHVTLSIDAADAATGAVRTVTVRTLAPDEQGHRAVALRQVQVQIPKGIQPGQHIRLAGQGSAGVGGAVTGDLYVEIQFKDASRLASQDVRGPLPLAPWEAALGAQVTTKTPAGLVTLTVPPDTPHGKRLRLKGRGLAGRGAGDMVLEVELALPPSTLPGARPAYEAMAEILGRSFHPRAGKEKPA